MCSKTQYANVESNRATIIDLLSMIERPGMESLIDHLLNSDYFTTPASTRYHNVFEGGLCQHSLNVTREFSKENAMWQKPLPQDSVIICGLLHDLCKIGAYIRTDNGYASVKGLKGHATVSISRIKAHIELTPPEDAIIRYHMSLFTVYSYNECSAWDIHKAIMRTPQVQIFAAIDMADSKRKTSWGDF